MRNIKVAVNGFGRIGRVFTRFLTESSFENIELVAINDLVDTATLAHLLKYDSVHGVFNHVIKSDQDHLYIDGKAIKVCSEKNPENLPWNKVDFFMSDERHVKENSKHSNTLKDQTKSRLPNAQ